MNTLHIESRVLVHGRGSQVQTADGQTLVDLELGFGASFLGHSHPLVTASLQLQAGQLMSCGRHPTHRTAPVQAMLSALLPGSMIPAGLYSTGMEVSEFAMRVAATHTGRTKFAGFTRSMHGKSVMTAALCWRNAPIQSDLLHLLPFVDEVSEGALLDQLESVLTSRKVAALFVEPVQGSNRAHEASTGFYEQVIGLCRTHGTLSVFDETLTGLYRTGPAFYCNLLNVLPDVLLFAKSLGNGFPLAAIALHSEVPVQAAALPGSTFSGNAMALAAVEGTLGAMQALPMGDLVAAIEARVLGMRPALAGAGATLRGRGALWCIELETADQARRAQAATWAAGLLMSCTDRSLRLVPAATIDSAVLREACDKIVQACMAAAA